MSAEPTVYVIDDDESVSTAMARLMRSAGLAVKTFGSAVEFLEHGIAEGPCCLIVDVRMPGMNGLELQEAVIARRPGTPIIFVTGYGSIPMSVQAIKKGAVDFLTKPFDDNELLETIHRSLERDRESLEQRMQSEEIRRRAATLTPREKEVFALVVAGKRNKQIGEELGISEKTVKVHRGSLTRKMQATSIVDLVRMAKIQAGEE